MTTGGGGLLAMMLAVSCTSLLLQGGTLAHLLRQRATYDAENVAGRGYVRTAACRVAAACIYVTAGLLDLAGVQVPGSGGVTPEALVVLTVVQLLWLLNSAMDIRARRQLKEKGRD